MDAVDKAQRDAFRQRLFGAALGAFDLLHVHLGVQLGLYDALAAAAGGLTSTELAAATGTAERYAREWCEQQAISGILVTAQPPAADGKRASGADGTDRLFALPAAHAVVLTARDHTSYLAPLGQGIVGLAKTLPQVIDAFRSGGGVPYAAYGEDVRAAVAALNRPMFLRLLPRDWIPALPDVHARLEAGPARVADVGCGAGWSSIGLALAYPHARVDGIDLDAASIAAAERNAAASDVGDRVRFLQRDIADPRLAATYDLVCAFETVHDMSDPVAALRAMRALRVDGGAVLVADQKVADFFTAPGDEIERFAYGWSTLHCLPVGLAGQAAGSDGAGRPAAGTGTVMRTATLRRYAEAAGFAEVEVLAVPHELWRFYRLR